MGRNEETGKTGKQPYVRPELECASVYEAAAATCCKVTTRTCSNQGKSSLGKDQSRSVVS